jgi:hypothetical protein
MGEKTGKGKLEIREWKLEIGFRFYGNSVSEIQFPVSNF